MIEQKFNKEKGIQAIVIRPNPAMPWHIIKKIYLLLGCFILLITIALSYINLYLVIPFYFIEFTFLGYALYITALKSNFYEEILVSAHNIKVRFVMKKNIKEYDLVKDWTHFKYEPPTILKHSILYFFYKNKKISIGQIVTDEERVELKNIIKNMGLS